MLTTDLVNLDEDSNVLLRERNSDVVFEIIEKTSPDVVLVQHNRRIGTCRPWLANGKTFTSISQLCPGDTLEHATFHNVFIVTHVNEMRALAVETKEITKFNCDEWEIVVD